MGPFTSVFGMGTGVASPPWPPGKPGSGRTRKKANAQSGKSELEHDATGQGIRRRPSDEVLKNGQTSRLISTGQLSASPRLRLLPIEVVVYNLPSDPFGWENLSLGRLGA